MSTDLVYLAAPYSHEDPAVVEQRMRTFLEVDAVWMKRGYLTVSPLYKHYGLAVSGLPGDWEYWQNYSRAMISHCCGVVVIKMEGWDTSVGVVAEIAYAKSLGIAVYYVNEQGDMDTLGGVK